MAGLFVSSRISLYHGRLRRLSPPAGWVAVPTAGWGFGLDFPIETALPLVPASS